MRKIYPSLFAVLTVLSLLHAGCVAPAEDGGAVPPAEGRPPHRPRKRRPLRRPQRARACGSGSSPTSAGQ